MPAVEFAGIHSPGWLRLVYIHNGHVLDLGEDPLNVSIISALIGSCPGASSLMNVARPYCLLLVCPASEEL